MLLFAKPLRIQYSGVTIPETRTAVTLPNIWARSCNLTARQTQAIIECNFPYFAAVMVPSANAKLLRIICDWGNWIFPFDNLFDNGDVRNDVARAMKVMDALEATFTEGIKSVRSQQEDCKHIKPLLDIAHMHESIFSAIRAHASAGE